jgi:hypothetical protein
VPEVAKVNFMSAANDGTAAVAAMLAAVSEAIAARRVKLVIIG